MRRRSVTPPFRSLLPLVALALVLRAGAVVWSVADHPGFFRPDTAWIEAELSDPAAPFIHPLGFEVSNVAWSLVCAGEGFASPFGGGTGPTAWVSPGIVAVWAVVFAVVGCFTPASVLLLLVVAGAASAAMVLLAGVAGARFGGDARTGRVAALLAACSPWDVLLFQAAAFMDLNLYALGLLGVTALLLAVRRRPSWGRLFAFAAGSAVATLFNPALFLAAAAGGALFLVPPPPGGRLFRAAALFVLVHLVVVGPWILHRRLEVGGWFFVKSNAPFEVALGNRPEVSGILRPETFESHHPSQSVDEYRSYRRLGERTYVERQLDGFVRRFEPARFARATGRRFLRLFFWHVPEPWQGPLSIWAHRLLTAIPGLLLLLYPVARRFAGRRLDRADALVYLATAGYAAPFLVAGVMERYTLVLSVPALLLAARACSGCLGRRFAAPAGSTAGSDPEAASGEGSAPPGRTR